MIRTESSVEVSVVSWLENAFMSASFRVVIRRTLGVVAALSLMVPVATAQESKEEKKAREAREQVERALVRVADTVHSGALPAGGFQIKASAKDAPTAAPADTIEITWKNDFFKAAQGMVHIPFTLSFEGGKSIPNAMSLFVRAAKKGTPPVSPKDKKDAQPSYPSEWMRAADAVAPAAGQPLEVTRRLVLAGGDYDIFVLLAPAPGMQKVKDDVMLKGVAAKFALTVPDYANNELTTSSLILLDKFEGLSTPMTPDMIEVKPYNMGAEIVPARSPVKKKTDELLIFYQVYNAAIDATSLKPDVVVEYEFFVKDGAEEKPAMSTDNKKLVYPPQKYNGSTLPPQFDGNVMPLTPALAVPLNLFAPGNYRVSIKVIDAKATKTITREVLFSLGA